MSGEDLPPLPEGLLEVLKTPPPVPSGDFEAQVLSRLHQTLAVSAAVGAGVTAGVTVSKKLLVGGAIALLVAGLGAGVALERTVFHSEPVAAPAVAPAPAALAKIEAAPAPPVTETKPVVRAPAPLPRPVGPPGPPPASSRDRDLSAEREYLEVARTALVRGAPAEALVAVERHERAFPNGRLAEEREVVCIQALVSLDRTDDARQRATRFNARWPESALGPTVDALVESRPK